jgi:hypothetical protein
MDPNTEEECMYDPLLKHREHQQNFSTSAYKQHFAIAG